MTKFTQNEKANGFVLAGTESSSGKTAIACMLISALRMQDLQVQPFKVGPDFIDPMYHNHYSQYPCYNLDSWMMGKERVLDLVKTKNSGKTGIIEGVMGLFDGASSTNNEGSTLEIATWLNWPIILVLPCQKAGRSLLATLQGFLNYSGENKICGVILNQVGGGNHAAYLKEALQEIKIPIFGIIYRHEILNWKERYLGLIAYSEIVLPTLEEIGSLGRNFLALEEIKQLFIPSPKIESTIVVPNSKKRIALARDDAFHFYYQDNLEFIEELGGEIVEFSPLNDEELPKNIEGIILGGGFPEIFAEKLSKNQSMMKSIQSSAQNKIPIYGECAGLVYLAETLLTTDKTKYKMLGLIPGAIQMTKSLKNFGYCICKTENSEKVIYGHEFHNSQWLDEEALANLWEVQKKNRNSTRMEGFQNENIHGSYIHIYFRSAGEFIKNFFLVK